MPKIFYTEIDIKKMAEQGIQSLEINDNMALTDLAHETARRLGVKLVCNQGSAPPAQQMRACPAAPELAQRIRNAVTAQMGDQIAPPVLDTIIQRVLTSTGLK